jgi:Uma2 family endonuclease
MGITTESLMTVDEFMEKYAGCSGVELIEGKVVWNGQESHPPLGEVQVPRFKHGVVSHNVDALIGGHIRTHGLGWVAINDTFVPVKKDPATVRGADLLYVSYARLPKGKVPDDLAIAPDLVIEVRSPSDRLSLLTAKVEQYIAAGVPVVVVFDPRAESAAVFRGDEFPQVFHNSDEFVLPDVLPGFAIPVQRFFE